VINAVLELQIRGTDFEAPFESVGLQGPNPQCRCERGPYHPCRRAWLPPPALERHEVLAGTVHGSAVFAMQSMIVASVQLKISSRREIAVF
jgi:hypothetical protein